jgi:hypothetical protein
VREGHEQARSRQSDGLNVPSILLALADEVAPLAARAQTGSQSQGIFWNRLVMT